MAPVPIAWAAMGFALDDRVARDMARLLGVEVSFVAGDGSSGVFVASSLPAVLRPAVERAARQSSAAPFSIQAGTDEYLTWTRPIRSANGPLGLVLQRSLTAALQPFVQLRNSIAAIGLVILAIASALAALLSRGATRPVEDLTRAAERLEAGDYEASVPEAATSELSRLSSAFNTMRLAISERERTIRHQASHDRLTGLPTRSRLTEILDGILSTARRHGHPVAACLIEIQQLQDVVGSFGHAAADEVVCEMARRLSGAGGVDGCVARIGTDQFAVALQGFGGPEASRRAEELAAGLRAPLDYGAVSLQLEMRMGVSVFPDDAGRADELLQRADLALYRAKESGSVIGTFVRGDDEIQRHRLSVLGDLRRAIAADELELHYQPKVALPSAKAVGCEALVRWRHPVRGLVPPGEFIAHAERAGLITSITAWVLRAAFRQLRAWELAGIALDVAVNVSPADLADPAFADSVAMMLAESGVDASRVVLEVTESAAMKDLAKTVRVMEQLRVLGVRFAIDDFGTGYSSLAHLKRLPVSELKIDRSFIQDLEARQGDDVIVRSTIDLGHALNLKVVAEGVEVPYSWQVLDRLGCDLVQGYFVARPMPASEFTAWAVDKTAIPPPATAVAMFAETQVLPRAVRSAG
jgi:diguanylate cyclase (GGDEF)-like protein